MGIENPHDKLDPVTSKDIIIAHVTDGVKMLEEYHIPQEIIDIAWTTPWYNAPEIFLL